MAGPTFPTRRLPQGVPFREVEPEPSAFWQALSSGADQGMDPTTQAIVANAPITRRHTADIQLGGDFATPAPPEAPPMFQPAMQGLESSRTPMPEPPAEDLERMRARRAFEEGGWTDPSIDWASEREGFLAQGNARREAQDAEYRRMANTALMPKGRSALDAAETAAAMRGFEQARNPAFARQQRALDAQSGAETFMSPIMAQRRGMEREEELAGKAGNIELGLKYSEDPRTYSKEALEHQRALELATARNPNNMGGGITAPQMYTEQEIREQVLSHGGDENDVLDTISDARRRGQLR